MRHQHLWFRGLIFLFALTPGLAAQDADKGLEAVKGYLKQAHAKKKWQTGPAVIASDAIQQAYGAEQKFYYVFSPAPLPPGANIPELIQAFQNRVKDHRENFLSLTMRLDPAGKVIPLHKPADYNQGLMAVKNEADAKVAAAAVLSLYGFDKVAPGVVKTAEVKVAKTDSGWVATVERVNQFQATVVFNNKGQVTSVTKDFAGPVPP